VVRLLALLAAATLAVAADAPVTVRARLEPATATVGERVRWVVEATAPAGVDVELPARPEKLDLDVVDAGDLPATAAGGARTVGRWYALVGWSVGSHAVPAPTVRWRGPGGSGEAHGDAATLEIRSVLGDAPKDADIRDVKPPEAFPPAWQPWALGAGVLLAAVALAWWLRRRRRAPRPVPAPPPRPAHVLAAEALAALRARRLPEQGAFVAFYAALSDIVRAYLERRFALRAPEMTTEEFLAATAAGGALRAEHRALLADFLAEADLVKFARHVPAVADAERAFAAAERVVAETADRLTEDARAAG
jgi:hypothetical protein